MVLFYWIVACLLFGTDKLGNTASPLPKSWEKEFKIVFHYDGGIRFESIDLLLSKDSCIYTKQINEEKHSNHFKLSHTELEEVLEKLHRLNADKLRSMPLKVTEHGKATDKICFGANVALTCIENGPSTTLHPKDQSRFRELSQYLIGVAEMHSR